MNWWIGLCLLLTLGSCLPDKIGKKDPEPDIAGVYQINSLISNGVTVIPRSGVSGSIQVTKISDSQISVSLSLTNNGQTSNTALGTVSITKSGGNTYNIAENGVTIGSVDGTTFTLNASDNTGNFSLTARK